MFVFCVFLFRQEEATETSIRVQLEEDGVGQVVPESQQGGQWSSTHVLPGGQDRGTLRV